MDMINNLNLFMDLNVQEWTYIIVGFTFSIYIAIAIWSRVQTTKDFYVAGAGVSPLANGMATARMIKEFQQILPNQSGKLHLKSRQNYLDHLIILVY